MSGHEVVSAATILTSGLTLTGSSTTIAADETITAYGYGAAVSG